MLTSKKAGAPTSSSTAAATKHIEGNTASNVKLQEFGDYQCPACGQFYTAVNEVVNKYHDQISFQFSNLPLPQLHQNAYSSARAAEAAGLQGKYFEMHDLLYTNQQEWSQSKNALTIFTSYANRLGLNIDQFKADYASAKVNDAINADVAAFKKKGDPMATPTFYLNGKKIDNAQLMDANGPSVAQISKLIDAALAAQKK
jgi:protein-disulfide isomerase